MSFSYDTSLPSFKDKVRLLIFDTVQATAVFSDEEIAAWETVQSNIFLAASDLCSSIGLKLAQRAIKFDTSADVRGGLSVDRSNLPKWWFQRAKDLKEQAMTQGVDEIVSHFAFDIDANGRDRSQYQGRVDCVDDF